MHNYYQLKQKCIGKTSIYIIMYSYININLLYKAVELTILTTKAANYILRFTKLTLCIYEVNILGLMSLFVNILCLISFLSLLHNIQA